MQEVFVDTFLVSKNGQQVEKFKQYLNIKNMHITFAFEVEIENSLSFLYIKKVGQMVSLSRQFIANQHSAKFLRIMKVLHQYL